MYIPGWVIAAGILVVIVLLLWFCHWVGSKAEAGILALVNALGGGR